MTMLVGSVRSGGHGRYRAASVEKRRIILLAQLRPICRRRVGRSIIGIFGLPMGALAVSLVEVWFGDT